MKDLQQFISHLNSHLAQTPSLHAVFTTYNRVGTYGNGDVAISNPDLRITVVNGGYEQHPLTLGLLAFGDSELQEMAFARENREAGNIPAFHKVKRFICNYE
jgi:hypothetical protein